MGKPCAGICAGGAPKGAFLPRRLGLEGMVNGLSRFGWLNEPKSEERWQTQLLNEPEPVPVPDSPVCRASKGAVQRSARRSSDLVASCCQAGRRLTLLRSTST